MPEESNRFDLAKQQKASQKSKHQKKVVKNNSPNLDLFTITKEINKEAFTKRVGESYVSKNPAIKNALRIAEISLNEQFLASGNIMDFDKITLRLFDNKTYLVMIEKENVTTSLMSSIALRGTVADIPTAVLFFSMTEKQFFVTLRLPDNDLLYAVIYIHPEDKHYLFTANITAVEQYKCEVRIPQSRNNVKP